ncbi:MAG: B12-binding domain-containing radical SAM protein [Bacteroidota bacterium]
MKKFNLALISPGREGSVVSGRWKGMVNFYRLTLPLLAGLTPKDRYTISIFDECVDTIPLDRDFDLVAMSVMTAYAPRAYELCRNLQKRGSIVVLGGHHPTLLPTEAMEYADTVAIGDAEAIWPQILQDFEKGILQKIYHGTDIGADFNRSLYPDRYSVKQKSMLVFNTVETSRGCPYLCDYCTIASFYKSSYRKYSIESVMRDIESTNGKYIFFVDDNLIGGNAQDRNRTKELLRALIPLNKRWFCQATVKFADDEELLSLAALAGCVGVYLGLESISTESLNEVRKGWNKPESYSERIKRIRSAGIAIEAGLIFGFDHDNRDVFKRTAEFIIQTGIESPNGHLLTPYPGTPLFDRMQSEKRILTYDWSLYNTGNVVFKPLKMTPDELFEGYVNWYQKMFSTSTIVERLTKANFPYYTALIGLAKAIEVRRREFHIRKTTIDSKTCPTNLIIDCGAIPETFNSTERHSFDTINVQTTL